MNPSSSCIPKIGIVTTMYGIDTVAALNRGDLGQGKGAIYESLVFDSLIKAGIEPYYFAKESGLSVDFVISYEGTYRGKGKDR